MDALQTEVSARDGRLQAVADREQLTGVQLYGDIKQAPADDATWRRGIRQLQLLQAAAFVQALQHPGSAT